MRPEPSPPAEPVACPAPPPPDELELLRELNQGSLSDPRVTVHNADAMFWLEQQRSGEGSEPFRPWDVIVIDLPDPNNLSLGKLYTRAFYRLVRAALAPDGAGAGAACGCA